MTSILLFRVVVMAVGQGRYIAVPSGLLVTLSLTDVDVRGVLVVLVLGGGYCDRCERISGEWPARAGPQALGSEGVFQSLTERKVAVT